jgi:hypothetical protein
MMPKPLLPLLALSLLVSACSASDGGDDVGQSEGELAAGDVKFLRTTLEPGHAIEAGIPIGNDARSAKPVVVYSVPLSNVSPNETLRIEGQVSLSRCNNTDVPTGGGPGAGDDGSPCETHKSYGYEPHIQARLVLRDGHGAVVLDTMDYVCTLELHHCPLIVTAHKTGLNVAHGSIDVEVIAYTSPGDHPSNDVVELEGECDHDRYNPCHPGPQSAADEQKPGNETQGQLTVVRSTAAAAAKSIHGSAPIHDRIPITTASDHSGGPTLLFSQKLEHLRPGDVIEASATVGGKNDPKNAPYKFDHFFGSWIFLTSSPTDTRPMGPGARWISPFDGKNCDTGVPGGTCKRDQVGAALVPADVAPGATMYVNVAGWAIEKGPHSQGISGKILDVPATPVPSFYVLCTSTPRTKGDAPCSD